MLNKALRSRFTQRPRSLYYIQFPDPPKISTSHFRKQNQESIQTLKSLKDWLVQSPEFIDEETEAHRDEVISLIVGLRFPRYRAGATLKRVLIELLFL